MIKRICQHPNCHEITTSTRCPQHQIKHTTPIVEHHKAQRRTRDGRNTAAWQRLRHAVLARDPVCTCGAPTTHAHYLPTGHHSNDLDLYQGMCAHCHGQLHGRHQHQRGGAVVA